MDDLSAILASIFSSGTFNEMLRRATPVALAAIGGSLTEHAGIMNIGMDGMILMGAFFGVFGSYLFTSAWGGVGLVLLMGLLVGLFFALFVVKFRSDEFIIGCALNTFALGLTTYLSRSVFGTSGAKGFPSLPTVDLPLLDKIPFLGAVLNGHSLFVYLTWLFVLVLWVFIYKTPYGFWLRASGEKPETLRTAGIEPEKMKWLASILCGVLCALAGAHLSLGYLNGTFAENMSNSRGYIAFACVIFGAANPAKAYLAALMFGFFDAIGLRLQDYVSSDLTGITDHPTRFADDLMQAELVRGYTVRPTDIDFGRHMNNVAYVRVLLDCFSAAELASGRIASMEVHYAAPCLEGEELGVYCRREENGCRLAIKKADGKAAVLAAVKLR